MKVSRIVETGVIGHSIDLSTAELIVMADFVQEINEVLKPKEEGDTDSKSFRTDTIKRKDEEIEVLRNLLTASNKILGKISAGIESLKDAEKSLFEDVTNPDMDGLTPR